MLEQCAGAKKRLCNRARTLCCISGLAHMPVAGVDVISANPYGLSMLDNSFQSKILPVVSRIYKNDVLFI